MFSPALSPRRPLTAFCPPSVRCFAGCDRHGKLDWKKLARVDVDDVVREVDLTVLQDLLDEVYCTVSLAIGHLVDCGVREGVLVDRSTATNK